MPKRIYCWGYKDVALLPDGFAVTVDELLVTDADLDPSDETWYIDGTEEGA